MAETKTVKKRRVTEKGSAKRRVASLESVVDVLKADVKLSPVNKRAVIRVVKAATVIERQNKQVSMGQERLDKARAAAKAAGTPAAKERAKQRVATTQAKLKEARAARSAATAEQKKAERLARTLAKALDKAKADMARAYDKAA
ncbi:MAG: hypothetical protein AB2814_08340 [Candidatus Sedimenticola endophacoides]